MRKKIIAGNWKMNKTPAEAVELAKTLINKVNTNNVDFVFCVPYIDIIPVFDVLKGIKMFILRKAGHIQAKYRL